MRNFIQKGETLDILIAAGCSSGDPIMIGSIGGVAKTDIEAGEVGPIALVGVFDLSVKAVNDSGNSAVSIGDQIFYGVSDTPKLSKKSSGKFFGYALEAILSGQTDTINILRVPYPGPGTSDILTAGVITAAMLEANIALVAPDLTLGASSHSFGSAHADWELSSSEMKSTVLVATLADQAVNAIATPTAGKIYVVANTSGQALTIKAAEQTGVTIASTRTAIVRGNGTDFVRVTGDA